MASLGETQDPDFYMGYAPSMLWPVPVGDEITTLVVDWEPVTSWRDIALVHNAQILALREALSQQALERDMPDLWATAPRRRGPRCKPKRRD